MAYLIFSTHKGEEIGRRPLEAETTIGRSSECDIALNDGLLSRRHCRLARTMEGWVVSDLGSRNGTTYRGERFARRVLRDGEVFQVGLVNVLFRAGEFTDEKQDGLRRAKRPATPLEANSSSDTGLKYEPPPPAQVRAAPVPARPVINADLDLLDRNGGLEARKF
jgi:pSer/pThr/pTyr-binding forkhead associated (FHA) protein